VVHGVRNLLNLSLAHLELLVPLHKLGLKVVDIVLGKSRLILGVLQLGAGVVEGIDLEVTAAVGLQQLVVHLLVAPLEGVALLE
jgi:hypothetical protein